MSQILKSSHLVFAVHLGKFPSFYAWLNSTKKYDFLPYGKITTKTQYKNNEKNIALLYKELDALNKGETDKYFELDREEAEKAGIIDGELSSLTRKRSRLVSQLNLTQELKLQYYLFKNGMINYVLN